MAVRKFKINIDGKSFVAEVEEVGETTAKTAPLGPAVPVSSSAPVAPAQGNAVVAPMPGKIISIKAKRGQQVKEGDVVIILEAMKMEQEIKSALSGTVQEIPVAEGDTVRKEQPLIIIS